MKCFRLYLRNPVEACAELIAAAMVEIKGFFSLSLLVQHYSNKTLFSETSPIPSAVLTFICRPFRDKKDREWLDENGPVEKARGWGGGVWKAVIPLFNSDTEKKTMDIT